MPSDPLTDVFYNDIDEQGCRCVEYLQERNHVASGEVSRQDIRELKTEDLIGYKQAHFFSGIGLWSLAFRAAGLLDSAPVWSASLPCQPFSTSGKNKGFKDERHLLPSFLDLVKNQRPPIIFGEQVASPAGRSWLGHLFLQMDQMGYRSAGADLCSAGVGAENVRQRLYWVAYADGFRPEMALFFNETSDTTTRAREAIGFRSRSGWNSAEEHVEYRPTISGAYTRRIKSGIEPVVNANSRSMGALFSYGNAINPRLAAVFVKSALEAIRDDNSRGGSI